MFIRERQHVVVLTYPGHFLLTQLTIRSIHQYMPGVSITVIADDCSELAWPTYFKDCCVTYSENVIPVSKVLSVANVTPGWLRQQMVKMHIDLYVEYDEVFLCDGDTILYKHIPYMVVPFQIIEMRDVDQHQAEYVATTLKRPFKRFTREGSKGIVNFPGFRETEVEWWKELRKYIKKKHNQTPVDYHMQYTPLNGVSEWELLEQFKHYVLQLPVDLHIFSNVELTEEIMPPDIHFATSWNSDKHYPYKWWQGQEVDLDAWDKLPGEKGIWTK